ncbi:haloacid dehalogenase type II [Mycolicibacterium holsaticum]|uniref:haloacid dehalogenase type II n=1 Tax=Mycolicibacterium holsaticum TaxID=152142 RepID=UPI001C7D2414|nr:haloacid dehalogenase type II [Mycolicibacterium holsaticum]QZA11559.1 haloacid dehalogenase type II [Mycolicibacterium holsaticum DSM 44478 = JCM 12374]UNC10952.1 haloacid dehalogenase type II [Mycolicibacterium holsaticum DSM 44478 = JCM 12374]
MPSVLVFDVNETLLDLDTLKPYFARLFGDESMQRAWFGELVTYSMAATLAGYYTDFFTLGRAVLDMLADIRGIDVTDADREELVDAMQTMPAHPDVAPGLQRLLDLGYRLATLTNSPPRQQGPSPLETAGLGAYFERRLSVDALRVFKPCPELYRDAARQLGVGVSDCMMVAAHMWDLIGARAAGFSAALITRTGNAPLPAPGLPLPTLIASDIEQLAIELDNRRKSSNAPDAV